MKNKNSIIIVHWNTPRHLKKLLSQFSKTSQLEVIVVDNNSSQSVDWITKKYSHVHLIKNNVNRGYAFACNQGALTAGVSARRSFGEGEWLLFLNPDVQISLKQIDDMILFAEENNLSATSPRSSSGDYEKPLPSCLSLLVEFTPLNRVIPLSMFPSKTLFGGCLLIRTKILKKLGGWDERFFLWFEDSDLTTRLLKEKLKVDIFPHRIKHCGGVALRKLDKKRQRDFFFHSMRTYVHKHFSTTAKFLVRIIINRYTSLQLLPHAAHTTSITVPNMDKNLLKDFFFQNKNELARIDELIVVTSALKANAVWEWRIKYPKVRFIPIEKNEGFAATVNIGFRTSTGKYLGTVNDDTILKPNCIEKCLECASKEIGSINPVIYGKGGEIESAGVQILKKGCAHTIKIFDKQKKCLVVDATNAAVVIYAKEALNLVGLLDEKFHSYLEDIDLSLRLGRAGFKNVVATRASVVHIGHASSSALGKMKAFYDFRNWTYVILKNWSLHELIRHSPSILLERLRNLSGVIKAYLRA